MKSQKIRRGCFMALIICIIVYTAWYVYGATSAATDNECEGIIRFHVVANSDSAEDQRLKLKVRDGLLAEINRRLVWETMSRDDCTGGESVETGVATLTIEESRQYLQENMKSLETLAAEIVSKAGYQYPVTANLGVCWIPEKIYGDITFPAGNYEALNICIGEAEGQNWWCVLYPPLCLIEAGSEATAATSPDNATDTAATTDVIYAGTADTEAIRLKFKTLEILDKAENMVESKKANPGTSKAAIEKFPGSW